MGETFFGSLPLDGSDVADVEPEPEAEPDAEDPDPEAVEWSE